MIYIRKIFKQDLRDGKQIAFPKEPSNSFFNFNFNSQDADRHINFKFKVSDASSLLYQHKDQEVTTRLYAAGSESRIDGELKQFLRDTLHAQINDLVIFKRINDSSYDFEYVPIDSFKYDALNELLSNSNHLVAITQAKSKRETVKLSTKCIQQIFYGAPGTGKSHKVKQITEGKCKTVVTFHPDTDYSSFVGAYKPTLHEDGKTITYGFVPQAFAKAYINAWKDTDKDYYLVIEEINRGNCAQIFGDIFQLLDRNLDGYSDYVIDVDKDFEDYLKKELSNVADYPDMIMELAKEADLEGEFSFAKISLPANLHIIATMNTSDQSLFPMDSAFKRRWDWIYTPIDPKSVEHACIKIKDKEYSWSRFITKVNEKIYNETQSEDKKIGNHFIKIAIDTNKSIQDRFDIDAEKFRSKVMFYLWFEVFKDASNTNTIFAYNEGSEVVSFTFTRLFEDGWEDVLIKFMDELKVSNYSYKTGESVKEKIDELTESEVVN